MSVLPHFRIRDFARQRGRKLLRNAARLMASSWPWPVPVRVGSRTLFVDLRSAIGRGIYVTGAFDPLVFDPIRRALRPGGVFLDVGANIGYYSVLALDCVKEHGEVHAFEIDPRPLRCLRRTKRHNGAENLTIHEVAVGSIEGSAYLMPGSDCGHTSVAIRGPGRCVPMRSLDDIVGTHNRKPVQAIKIDVEGGEMRVLKGARELLKRDRPTIICEVVDRHLRANGSSDAGLRAYLADMQYKIEHLVGVNTPTIVGHPC